MNQQMQIQMPPLSKFIKTLMIINGVVWFLGVVLLEGFVLKSPWLTTQYLGLSAGQFIFNFHLWQPLTYMFVHAPGPFHILMNMLLLWMFGGDLDRHWGSRFFGTYYFVCGIGSGVLYALLTFGYWLLTGDDGALLRPVVGASGALFGLLLAYGIIFGERTLYVMMLFPMKAKWAVMIFGAIELVSILNNGLGGSVSNLSHLLGIVVGFVFLSIWPWLNRKYKSGTAKRKSSHLKLVVNGKETFTDDNHKPKYWN